MCADAEVLVGKSPDQGIASRTARLRKALTGGSVSIPRYQPGGPLEVRFLGRGATNTAWQIITDSDAFVLRVPHRSAEEAPRPMKDEFAALARVPTGVGTRGIAFDDSADNPLDHRYVLTTFVPGQIKDAAQWEASDFARLAKTLARLHTVEEALAGPVHAPEHDQVSLSGHLEAGLQWWKESHPTLFKNPDIASLVPVVQAFVRRCEDKGGVARRFSLIHGDLIVGNVVSDGDDMSLIDWEWAEFGDVAQDLAYIGGTIHGGPDYAPMTQDLINYFVDQYVAEMRRAGKDTEDASTLRARRAGWEACERFLTLMHTMTSPQNDETRLTITSVRRTLTKTVCSPPNKPPTSGVHTAGKN